MEFSESPISSKMLFVNDLGLPEQIKTQVLTVRGSWMILFPKSYSSRYAERSCKWQLSALFSEFNWVVEKDPYMEEKGRLQTMISSSFLIKEI